MSVIKLTSKTKIIKPLFFVLAGITVGVIVTAVAITRYPLPARIVSLVAVKASPTPVAITSPSPLPQLSERALKVTAWLVTNSPVSATKEAKKKRGNENMSDAELVKILATAADADPALLAVQESKMVTWLAEKNRPIVNVDSPDVNVEAPSTKQTCITSDVAGSLYTTCR